MVVLSIMAASAAPASIPTFIDLCRLLRAGLVSFADSAAHDLAVEREGLQHDIEAAAVLVREYKPEIEPKVILAFASDHRIGAVRRLLRFTFVRHCKSPLEWTVMSCVGRRQDARPGACQRGPQLEMAEGLLKLYA